MKKILCQWLFCGIIMSLQVNAQNSKQSDNRSTDNIPIIPVGLDSYRMWDKWPQQRIGVRAYMRSTYDRKGGNEGVDASHFLFANEETFNVTLDVKGKGILYFFRANHWHGSPWHFIVDHNDNIVKESGTLNPETAKSTIQKSEFIPTATFPEPLNYTWATTKGADLIWTPIPFTESLSIAYSRTRYGTGYYIYHLYANEDRLSRKIQSWNIHETPEQNVLELISRSGTDIAPNGLNEKVGKIKLNKERILLTNIKVAPSMVRAIKLTIPLEKAIELERLRLVITWDEAKHPSVDSPLCLFFGAGTFYNRNDKEYLVKAFPVNIRYDYLNKRVELGCYFPMPFYKSAKIELTGIVPGGSEISYEIRYEPLKSDQKLFSYFHATYKDIPEPEPGKDMVFLDTKGEEGFEHWSGQFVGTSYIFSHKGVLTTLEGDPRFFIDDSGTPNYGTGSEEWGGGGDYWGGETMTLPFAGHPVGSPDQRKTSFTKFGKAKNEKDLIQSAYRYLLADLMPFGQRAVIGFEHGGENLSTEHYESVTYWYGVPSPALILTDVLNIGNAISEREHGYTCQSASEVQSITSRYEWGIDTFPEVPERDTLPNHEDLIGKEVYPAHTEVGRYMQGVSEFKIKLDSENIGAMLRRTMDYSFPNQTAEVYVADASQNQSIRNSEWEHAGIWYTAGANTLIYSNPKGELDNRHLNIQTSNRRFRDDEFLIPVKLTDKRSAIWVRIKFVPNNQELFPGTPFPKENAWSEIRYKAYSYVIPEFFQDLE